MTSATLSRRRLAATAVVRLVLAFIVLAALLFVPAGTLSYWQAWAFLATLLVPVVLVFCYLLIRDPSLLERRMRTREKEEVQGTLVKLGTACYLLAFVVPGLDRRFGWSDVAEGTVFTANAVFLLAYALFVRVLQVNSYASRVVEVEDGQRLVATGPYAIVRHPMYVAVLVMFFAAPVALGSWWALIPAVPQVAVIVLRIRNEEQVLRRSLAGYEEYVATTRYRLLPGLW